MLAKVIVQLQSIMITNFTSLICLFLYVLPRYTCCHFTHYLKLQLFFLSDDSGVLLPQNLKKKKPVVSFLSNTKMGWQPQMIWTQNAEKTRILERKKVSTKIKRNTHGETISKIMTKYLLSWTGGTGPECKGQMWLEKWRHLGWVVNRNRCEWQIRTSTGIIEKLNRN